MPRLEPFHRTLYTAQTMELPQLDAELARRIELAEAQVGVDCAESLKRSQPQIGAAVEHVAGGFAVYCGANSPITQAVGLGLDGPVGDVEMDRLEEFYWSRREAVRVETCPLAHASLIDHFGRRGYRVTEFSNVMARQLDAGEAWPAPVRGVTIKRIGSNQIDLWTVTVAQGFAESSPVPQEMLDVMGMFARGAASECFLARIDEEIAGGGALALRNGLAGLFGASTLPAFRGRGVQTALLQTRLARAAEAGCDLAVSFAPPGSISQRNIVRQGFRVLYTRVKFEKAFAAQRP